MHNYDIADLFERMADLMSIRGDIIHRTLAYRKAAETLRAESRPVEEMVAAGEDLTALPSIGGTLASKITELVTTGKLQAYDKLTAELPATLVELLRVEGVGPKRVNQIYKALGVATLDALQTAAAEGKLADLPGLGAKSAEKILHNLQALRERGDSRQPLGEVYALAHDILATLQQMDGVQRASVGGSLRRMRDTIGDIDLLIGIDDGVDPQPIMDRFVSLPLVGTIEGHGTTKSSVFLKTGIKVDLRVLPLRNWGALLSYFTGSMAHNVRLRELAQKQGLSLNEYAFTRESDGAEIIPADEEAVYATLGLPYIPPTLRENRGEIEAAMQGRLPRLIEQADIVCDLHMHSTWSDGRNSILEMARAAQARGLQYIVISDHSRSLGVANGLSIERLRAQRAEIDAANAAIGDGFRILHGTEMEIKADGTLDYPDDVLAELDFVTASLHTGLSQPRAQVMARIMAAIDNPHVDMIAHPTGRMVGKRDGADLDMGAVIMAASATGTILEINAHPERLDLRDVDARRAADMGARIAINTDAHHVDDFALLHYGIATAQRAWIGPQHVVNTWPLERFLTYLRRNNR